jgi:sugar lactone lactonase YvrE
VPSSISDIQPGWVVPGGRVAIAGDGLPLPADGPPHVRIGGAGAHVVAASRRLLRAVVPPGATGGTTAIHIDELPGETAYIEVAAPLTSGLHQVDNPLFDAGGRLYATHSGARGTRVPVPLYRVAPDGAKEPIAVEVGNPTSLALGPDGAIYISSRFDGHVYRLSSGDAVELYATDLGVATGLAFGPDGELYVGDRGGTVFRVSPQRDVETFATLPASVAAFHLAYGPGNALFVAAPTLASHDRIYRIGRDRLVDTVNGRFGRPQGMAFDSNGLLYVVDALAGASSLYRLDVSQESAEPELMLTAPALVGLAFDPAGGIVLASNDSLWRLTVPLTPWLN